MSTLLFGVRRATSKPMASNLFRYSSRAPVGVTKSATTATASLTHITRRGAKRVGSLLIMSTMGLAYFQLKDSFALSAAGGSGSGSGELPDPKDLIAKVLEQYQAEISEMGVSGLAGFCSGYCLKRVSQEVAVGIGAVFMLLQTLQHMGYININYKKVNADVTKKLDLDGDGKLTQSDIKVVIDNLTSYLAEGLPSASGFATGFGLGFYYA